MDKVQPNSNKVQPNTDAQSFNFRAASQDVQKKTAEKSGARDITPRPDAKPFIPNPDEQLLIPEPDEQLLIPELDEQPFIPNPDAKPFIPNPDAKPFIPNPDAQTFIPNPDEQLLIPEPDEQLLIPELDEQLLIPNPDEQFFIPWPGVQTFIPWPGVQTFIPWPGVQTLIPAGLDSDLHPPFYFNDACSASVDYAEQSYDDQELSRGFACLKEPAKPKIAEQIFRKYLNFPQFKNQATVGLACAWRKLGGNKHYREAVELLQDLKSKTESRKVGGINLSSVSDLDMALVKLFETLKSWSEARTLVTAMARDYIEDPTLNETSPCGHTDD